MREISVKVESIVKRDFDTYSIYTIITDDLQHFTSLDSTFNHLKYGDFLKLNYQEVRTNNGMQKSIINFVKLNKDEGLQMVSKSQTKRTESQGVNNKFYKLSGKVYYAHIREPDNKKRGQYAPTNKYKLELVISDAQIAKLEGTGILVKEKPGIKGKFVSLKSNDQPTVVLTSGYGTDEEESETLEGDAIPLIGNGSEAVITAGSYKNIAKQGGEYCLGLNTLNITNLIPFQQTVDLTKED